jgi:DNA-binding MarR family transcriptional regulator
MGDKISANQVNDFLGSTRVFSSGLNQVIEKKLLREITGGQITFSQFKLLRLVALQGPHMLGDVAAFLGISPAAASKAVDKLVRRKLLRRTEAHPDRRAIELSLTEASRRLLAGYETARSKKLGKIFSQVSPAELHRTTGLLDRLSADLIDHNLASEEVCMDCGVYLREECLLRDLLPRICFYERNTTLGNGAAHSSAKGTARAKR